MAFTIIDKWTEISAKGIRDWTLRFPDLPGKYVIVSVDHIKEKSSVWVGEKFYGQPRVIEDCGKINDTSDSETEFKFMENKIRKLIKNYFKEIEYPV